MDVTGIPFNRFMGLVKSEDPAVSLLELKPSDDLLNHIGSVHAAAQFALAEACSGEYVLRRFAEFETSCIAFVRSSEVKFKKMASGSLRSRASLDDEAADKLLRDLEKKGRAFATVNVEVFDGEGDVTMLASFDWYVQKRDEAAG
jgi:acyl-coenzyme A thioesterase PaaI-like protein